MATTVKQLMGKHKTLRTLPGSKVTFHGKRPATIKTPNVKAHSGTRIKL